MCRQAVADIVQVTSERCAEGSEICRHLQMLVLALQAVLQQACLTWQLRQAILQPHCPHQSRLQQISEQDVATVLQADALC